jgi:hypothetical protein
LLFGFKKKNYIQLSLFKGQAWNFKYLICCSSKCTFCKIHWNGILRKTVIMDTATTFLDHRRSRGVRRALAGTFCNRWGYQPTTYVTLGHECWPTKFRPDRIPGLASKAGTKNTKSAISPELMAGYLQIVIIHTCHRYRRIQGHRGHRGQNLYMPT